MNSPHWLVLISYPCIRLLPYSLKRAAFGMRNVQESGLQGVCIRYPPISRVLIIFIALVCPGSKVQRVFCTENRSASFPLMHTLLSPSPKVCGTFHGFALPFGA